MTLKPPLISGCWDCGREWSEPGWVDAWIPDDLWLQIAPQRDGAGHLCIHCITAALTRIGARNVPVVLWAAPFNQGGRVMQLGDLTASDLGGEVEFADGGATYRARLAAVQHEHTYAGKTQTMVTLHRHDWHLIKSYPSDTPCMTRTIAEGGREDAMPVERRPEAEYERAALASIEHTCRELLAKVHDGSYRSDGRNMTADFNYLLSVAQEGQRGAEPTDLFTCPDCLEPVRLVDGKVQPHDHAWLAPPPVSHGANEVGA